MSSETLKAQMKLCEEFIENSDNASVFKILRQHPGLKNYVDVDTSLISLAARSNKGLVMQMVLLGVQPDLADTTGTTALMDYAESGDVEMVEFFLKNSADPNVKNSLGDTPFSFTCARNQLTCAKLLYAHGADINVKIGEHSGRPLDWALRFASSDFIEWLRSVGGISDGVAIAGDESPKI